MTLLSDEHQQRLIEEQLARQTAFDDALAGTSNPPSETYGRTAYLIVYTLVTTLRPQVEADIRQQRVAPPEDRGEAQIYHMLYQALQQSHVTQVAMSGTTQRLVPLSAVPRTTRRCSDCNGILEDIRIYDPGRAGGQLALNYAYSDSTPSPWLGHLPIAGSIEALICKDCERIFLYGKKKDAK